MGTKNSRNDISTLVSFKGGLDLESGFTLIEIIIVLTIIAILAVIAILAFQYQIKRANDAKRLDDLNTIKVAIEEYEKDHNCFPAPVRVSCNPGTGLQPYITKIPCDPVTNKSYPYDVDPNAPLCADWYRLFANLETSTGTSMGPGGSNNYVVGSPGSPPGTMTFVSGRYGCKSGVCVPIYWNNQRPGPECDPNYLDSNCDNHCGSGFECIEWQK